MIKYFNIYTRKNYILNMNDKHFHNIYKFTCYFNQSNEHLFYASEFVIIKYSKYECYDNIALDSKFNDQTNNNFAYLGSKGALVSHTSARRYVFSNYDNTTKYSENLSDDIFIFRDFLPHIVFNSFNNLTENETFKIQNYLLGETFMKFFNIIPETKNRNI